MTWSLAQSVSQLSNIWDRYKRPVKRLYQLPLIGIGYLYRGCLVGTAFVGITGSLGKTQTKTLIGAVLARSGKVRFDPGTDNRTYDVAKNLLRTLPGYTYCLQEIGMDGPGSMPAPVRLFRPDIGVITNIRSDHGEGFATWADHVREKATLIRSIPQSGWAILNADEAELDKLRGQTKAQVLTYGFCEAADIRAIEVIDEPPRPIAIRVAAGGEIETVQSRLHGTHSAYAILAALAVARALGIPLPAAVAAIAECEGQRGRMEYVRHADGVTFLLDDFKASEGSLDSITAYLRSYSSPQGSRILVLGSISYAKHPAARYRDFLADVRPYVNEIILVGELASSVASSELPVSIRVFRGVREAADYLNPRLRDGDLVVLKGRLRTDHLRRIEISRRHTVRCWQMSCERMSFCDECPFVETPMT